MMTISARLRGLCRSRSRGVYAVWKLINSSCLLQAGDLQEETLTVDYTSGRQSSGWRFEDCSDPQKLDR